MSAERFRVRVEGWGGTVEVSNFKKSTEGEAGSSVSTVCLSSRETGPCAFCWHITSAEARDLARVLTDAAEALDAGDREVAA